MAMQFSSESQSETVMPVLPVMSSQSVSKAVPTPSPSPNVSSSMKNDLEGTSVIVIEHDKAGSKSETGDIMYFKISKGDLTTNLHICNIWDVM